MTSFLSPELFPILAFLAGGLLLLLLNGLSRSPRLRQATLCCGIVLTLGLFAAGATAAALDADAAFWAPPLVLAAIYLILFVVPSPSGRVAFSFVASQLSRPAGRTVAILLASGAAVGASVFIALERCPPPPIFVPEGDVVAEEVKLEEVSWAAVFTDQGRRITMRTNPAFKAGTQDLAALKGQTDLLQRQALRDQVIHLPLGWQNCNCHGFTFTGGQFWIISSEVDAILEDNGYRPVTLPRPGDIAVYRSPDNGQVTHTGIVRYVSGASNVILVESKWGNLGRFIHPHDTHCYGIDECTFHRSPRVGHRLQGLTSEPAPSMPEPDYEHMLPGKVAA